TSVIARSLVPRNGSTKSHEPFAPTVMNAKAASSRPTPSPIMTQRERRSTGAGASPADDGARSPGRSELTSSDTGTSPQQEEQERGRADHADDDADRHLVRVTDRAPEEVAHEHEAGPAERDPGCGASQVVPEHQGHDVGHHEPQERDRADGHDDDGGHHRDDRQAEREHGAVVHAEVRDEVLPHARDGESVGDEVGHHDEREREPQQLVAATQHAGEVARHPRVERLHQVEAVGEERRDGVDDAAEHEADERDDEHAAQGHVAQDAQEQRGPGERGDGRDEHLDHDGRAGGEDRDGEDADRRGLDGSRRRGFDEAVAREQLHDLPGDRHARPGEKDRDRAGHPGGEHEEHVVAGAVVGPEDGVREACGRDVADADEQAHDREQSDDAGDGTESRHGQPSAPATSSKIVSSATTPPLRMYQATESTSTIWPSLAAVVCATSSLSSTWAAAAPPSPVAASRSTTKSQSGLVSRMNSKLTASPWVAASTSSTA